MTRTNHVKSNNVTGRNTIFTRCPNCGKLLRVPVDFPYKNKGFTTTNYTCDNCECVMIVEDKHKYNKDGFIIR